MKFGKIEYLNLLPFDVFIKRYPTRSGFKGFLNKHKSYPSKLNISFLKRQIDAGFISSIAAYYPFRKNKATNAGIIARGSVWSVLLLPRESKSDYQSASSNALAKALNLNGEVLIGDRALKYKLSGKSHIDLGQEWYKRQNLGFVFGRMCFNKNKDFYTKMANAFVKKPVKIPHFLLRKASKSSGIESKYIKEYLKHIFYRIDKKEQIALLRFYSLLRLKRIKKPSRFNK